ncbi:MAG: aspartate--tRNA ligase [Saprospiraceae bacterium]|nr:aspartate--tRNA ligase [Saprospiraceae bacterium]
MYRSHTCGELRSSHIGQVVTLSGWVQKSRDKGFMIWVDLRDRYGMTQLIFDENNSSKELMEAAKSLGREFVIQATGLVIERESKNDKMPTGDIEIKVTELKILNAAKTPPFTIEDETDGGDDLRMKYRYLDLRRSPVQKNIIFRSKMAIATRAYLADEGFIEIETPNLIKSTPEGARDFVVPSRMNPGQFYALPQSPQTFKQILMVAGYDKYFQIVKCFRDEDLRADRQPEFTQIDCEMAFVHQEDILNTFEGLTKHLFDKILGVTLSDFPRMQYDDAMRLYGSDKPDIRFGMEFAELKSPHHSTDLTSTQAKAGDLILVLCGEVDKTRKQLGELRLEMGNKLNLRDPKVFKPLWVLDFPLLEWDEDAQRFFAMHHPFTSPKKDDVERMLNGDHETMKALRADAYDLVLNGVEIGGGSIRIHDKELQSKNFKLLGFTPEQAEDQFGFLLGAFEFGAPPHGGIAFGFDRLCSVMCGSNSIRDFIAFPKNNQGRDMMIDAPSLIDQTQLKELSLEVKS